MKKIIFRFWFKLNYLYSVIWIRLNRSDKYEYREKSRFHAFCLSHMMKNLDAFGD